MTTRATVEKYFHCLVSGDFEEAGKLVAPEHKRWISGEGSWPFGGWQTKESMSKVFSTIKERFPKGLQITIRNILVEGERASVHIRNYAERLDGKIYDNEIVHLLKVENGLITELQEFLDTIKVNDLFFGPLNQKNNLI